MKVFAYPTMQNKLCGLCGNWDLDGTNDLTFRNGTSIAPPQQEGTRADQRNVDPIYGNDWEVRNYILVKIHSK